MKQNIFILALYFLVSNLWAQKPMEPIRKTIVVLVHGTHDAASGLCEDNSAGLADSFSATTFNTLSPFRNYLEANALLDLNHHIYSRSMTRPDESPIVMAQELGDRTWDTDQADAPCNAITESFFEEATQTWFDCEVAAATGTIPFCNGGEHSNEVATWVATWNTENPGMTLTLNDMRTMNAGGEPGRVLIPSRFVIISHSMGGVTSREYVHADYYNGDVDKVITVDSPHEGTHALDHLIALKNPAFSDVKAAVKMGIAQFKFANSLYLINNPLLDIFTTEYVIHSFIGTVVPVAEFTVGILERIGAVAFDDVLALQPNSGITSYITPKSSELRDLNTDIFNQNQFEYPSFRLFHGEGSVSAGNFRLLRDVSRIAAAYSPLVPRAVTGTVTAWLDADRKSYTSAIDDDQVKGNVALASIAGLANVSFTEQGSNIIPHWSSIANNVAMFHQPNTSVNRHLFSVQMDSRSFAREVRDIKRDVSLSAHITVQALGLASHVPWLAWMRTLKYPGAIAALGVHALTISDRITEVMDDDALEEIMNSHDFPLNNANTELAHKTEHFVDRSYAPQTVQNQAWVDFLYEKPFVQLEVQDDNGEDALGLYDAVGNSLVKLDPQVVNANPITYRESFWQERVGIKKERFESVPAVGGNQATIRHVDRYFVPPMVVNDFIETYQFQIDDLRPKLAKQIWVTFNNQFRLKFEKRFPNSSSNFSYRVYREIFGVLETTHSATVNLPVNEYGEFELKPRDFLKSGESMLLAQKANQNVVEISVVNFAGKSSSQKFFYLFVDTSPLLNTRWPLPYTTLSTQTPEIEMTANLLEYPGIIFDFGNTPINTGFQIRERETTASTVNPADLTNNLTLFDDLPYENPTWERGSPVGPFPDGLYVHQNTVTLDWNIDVRHQDNMTLHIDFNEDATLLPVNLFSNLDPTNALDCSTPQTFSEFTCTEISIATSAIAGLTANKRWILEIPSASSPSFRIESGQELGLTALKDGLPTNYLQNTEVFFGQHALHFENGIGAFSPYLLRKNQSVTLQHHFAQTTGQVPVVERDYWLDVVIQAQVGSTGQAASSFKRSIPFSFDVTAPNLLPLVPSEPFNPTIDGVSLGFSVDNEKALRFVRAQILNESGTQVLYEFKPKESVLNNVVKYSWNGVDASGTTLPDGKYLFKVLAIDEALASAADFAHVSSLHSIVDSEIDGSVSSVFVTAWNVLEPMNGVFKSGINGNVAQATFELDQGVPEIQVTISSEVTIPDPNAINTGVDYTLDQVINSSEALKLDFKIIETDLPTGAISPVTVKWKFLQTNGDNVRSASASQEVVVNASSFASASLEVFQESAAGSLLEDGEYQIFVELTDIAGNTTGEITDATWLFRVDRTAAEITGLFTNSLTYQSATVSAAEANWSLNEAADVSSNQLGSVICYSRDISPSGVTSSWQNWSSNTATLPFGNFASENGEWIVELSCYDQGGNRSNNAFSYYVDKIAPKITTPTANNNVITSEQVAIFGMAPNPDIDNVSLVGIYNLSWQSCAETTTWHNTDVFVPQTRRGAGNIANVSEVPMPSVGYLGSWTTTGLSGCYRLRLQSAACASCSPMEDIIELMLSTSAPDVDYSVSVQGVADPFTPGANSSNPIQLSIASVNNEELEVQARIFGVDADNKVLFEQTIQNLSTSLFKGTPSNFAQDGIYIWQSSDAKWHIKKQNNATPLEFRIQYYKTAGGSSIVIEQGGAIVDCSTNSNTDPFSCEDNALPGEIDILQVPGMKVNQIMNVILQNANDEFVFNVPSIVAFDVIESNFVKSAGNSTFWIPASGVFLGANESTITGAGSEDDFFTQFLRNNSSDYTLDWNGLLQNGEFPTAGLATIQAEVTHDQSNGNVILRSAELQFQIQDASLSASIGSLSDKLSLTDNFGTVDGTSLGQIVLTYGVHGVDAYVTAGVREINTGLVVKTFFAEQFHEAKTSPDAYQVTWDGITDGGFVANAVDHEFFLEVTETLPVSTPDLSLQHSFPVELTNWFDVDGAGGNPGLELEVEDASILVPGNIQYINPKSDFKLVAKPVADVSSATEFNYQVAYSGTQTAFGFPAERFSLGLQRKRDELKLVVWSRITVDKIRRWQNTFCKNKESNHGTEVRYRKHILTFNKNSQTTQAFNLGVNNPWNNPPNCFNDKFESRLHHNGIKVKVFPFNSTYDVSEGNIASRWNQESGLWALSSGHNTNVSPGDDKTSCTPDQQSGFVCEADINSYNAHKNLIHYSSSRQHQSERISLTIPTSYWNPGFGYDNLVNKNMRMDMESKTVFGNNGWFAVDGYDNLRLSDGSTDGNSSYGLVTPSEVQSFRLAPTSSQYLNPLSFGNTGGLGGESKFIARFFGGPDLPSSRFEAKIYTRNCLSPTSNLNPFCNGGTLQNFMTSRSDVVNTNPVVIPDLLQDAGGGQTQVRNLFVDVSFLANYQALEQAQSNELLVSWPIQGSGGISVNGTPTSSNDLRGALDTDQYCSENVQPGCFKVYPRLSKMQYCGGQNANLLSGFVDGSGLTRATFNAYDISGLGCTPVSGGIETPVITTSLTDFDGTTFSHTDVDHFKKDAGGTLLPIQGANGEFDFSGIQNLTASVVNLNDPNVSVVPGSSTDAFVKFEGGSLIPWSNVKDPHLSGRDLDQDSQEDEELDRNTDLDADGTLGEDVPGLLLARIREGQGSKSHLPVSFQNQEVPLLDLYATDLALVDRGETHASLFHYIDGSIPGSKEWAINPFIANVTLQDIEVKYIDGTDHADFMVDGATTVSYPAQDFLTGKIQLIRRSSDWERAKELITLRGKLPENTNPGTPYRLYYLDKTGKLVKAWERYYTHQGVPSATLPVLGHLDVNKIQGSTSLFLLWDQQLGGGLSTFYKKIDVQVGAPINTDGSATVVNSLYGDAEVQFAGNSFASNTFVTVRVTNPLELHLDQDNQLSVVGPVIEVLPSYDFSSLPPEQRPIVKMKLTREDLQVPDGTGSVIDLAPSSIKLYKPDLSDGSLTELSNLTYLFFDATGSSLCTTASSTGVCADNWSYMTIAGNTETFSIFVALNSDNTVTGDYSLTATPEQSSVIERQIDITGLSVGDFRLFLDDDEVFADANDATPKTEVVWSPQNTATGSSGLLNIPNREISYLYLIPKETAGTTVNAMVKKVKLVKFADQFSFAYTGENSVFLGTQNGGVSLPYNANHTGSMQLVLEQNGNVVGIIPSSLQVPTGAFVWDGRLNGLLLAEGVYQTKLSATSVSGENILIQGPTLSFDTGLPIATLSGSYVQDQGNSDVTLQYSFADSESSVEKAHLTLYLGGNILLLNQDVTQDGSEQVHVSKALLESCIGCLYTAELQVEDAGGNTITKTWVSDPVYPLPNDLVFWYPFVEGAGRTAYDIASYRSHLNLNQMSNAWFAPGGLNFKDANDEAQGISVPNAFTNGSTAFSVEWWLHSGYGIAKKDLFHWIGGTSSSVQGKNWSISKENKDLLLETVSGEVIRFVDAVDAEKTWFHYVVTVDGNEVKLFKDGVLEDTQTFTATPTFASSGYMQLGKEDDASYEGLLGILRVFAHALSETEIQDLYDYQESENVYLLSYQAEDLSLSSGIHKDVSCELPSRYYIENQQVSQPQTLNIELQVTDAGTYFLFAHAWAKQANQDGFSVKLDGIDLGDWNVNAEARWNRYWFNENGAPKALNLHAGIHNLEIILKGNARLDWLALTLNEFTNIKKVNVPFTPLASAKVKVEALDIQANDPSWTQPRLSITNISNEVIQGYKVRYYIREDAGQALITESYTPHGTAVTRTILNQEFSSLDLDLSQYSLAPGESSFSGSGPDFAVRYPLWTGPQLFAQDDPSYVGLTNVKAETKAIPVFDTEGNIISDWICYDVEAEVEGDIEVRVVAKDNRVGFDYSDNPFFYVENIGSVPLREFEVRYYFTAEEGLNSQVDNYPTNESSMNVVHYGQDEYYASLYYTRVLNPGEKSDGGVGAQLELHYPSWTTIWDSSDDPSYQGLTSSFQETSKILVLDKQGNILWGDLTGNSSSSLSSSSLNSSSSGNSSSSSLISSSSGIGNWTLGTIYSKGEKIVLGDKVCEVIADNNGPWAHITPDDASMWSVWSCSSTSTSVPPPWVLGGDYTLGEQVTHNSKTWESLVASTQAWSSYEPDALGMHSVWQCIANCN